MNRFAVIFILILASSVQAGELRIVETDTEIIAEYTGTPSSADGDVDAPAAGAGNDRAAMVNDKAVMVNFITAQIEQLRRELADLLKRSGTESEEEQQAKDALAAEKRLQIKTYEDEIRRLTGNPQTEAVQKGAQRSEGQRETTRRLKELRQSRKVSSGVTTPEQ